MTQSHSPILAPMAAMLYPDDGTQEDLLCQFAAELRDHGLRIGGLLQRTNHPPGKPKGIMELVDVQTSQTFALSQDLGTGSSACTLDLSALATASVIVRTAIASECQILLLNKFSHQERVGRGLAPDMIEAVTHGIPVLTALRPAAIEDWNHFTGGHGHVLPPTLTALRDWVRLIGLLPG